MQPDIAGEFMALPLPAKFTLKPESGSFIEDVLHQDFSNALYSLKTTAGDGYIHILVGALMRCSASRVHLHQNTHCEAIRRPPMRFVTVKDENQQAMQCLHCTRQGFIEEKLATYNRL